jgi:hypothetical protein
MKKTTHPPAPSLRKRPVPASIGGWEFTLREHAIIPRQYLDPSADVVRTIGNQAIVRKAPRALTLNPAAPWSDKERESGWATLGKDTTGTDDPAALARIAEQALAKLARLAREGSGPALWKFAHIAYTVGEALSEKGVSI